MKCNKLFLFFLFTLPLSILATAKEKKGLEYYQLETYHFLNTQQEGLIDSYLKDAYLPALHRLDIKNVGVFKPIANDTAADKIVYVLVPFKSWKQVPEINGALQSDALYTAAGNGFLDAPYDAPAFKRKELALIKAFPLAPIMQLPVLSTPLAEHVYELRSYEGPTDNKYKNKVKMFNDGNEVGLFKRLGFNAVFYGEVMAGAKMPNLMYMTSFNNMVERDAHWKSFGADAEWKTLSSMPEYQHNVSKAEVILTMAAPYSDY